MLKQLLLPAVIFMLSLTLACNKVMDAPVLAPFTDLDTICTNDWWKFFAAELRCKIPWPPPGYLGRSASE